MKSSLMLLVSRLLVGKFQCIALSLLVAGSVFCTDVSADTFSINGTPPNRWPGQMTFTAPCGVTFLGTPGTASYYIAPPPAIEFSPQNSLPPVTLCARMMRTLTDPDGLSVTTIGAVNPQFMSMPNGSALPLTSTVSGIVVPQPPQNAPISIKEVSVSGTMDFSVPISFRDQSDSMFEGRFEGVLEVPYDAFKCPNLSGSGLTDQSTGLIFSTAVLGLCAITTPADYLAVLTRGHEISWAEFSSASVVGYGPTDNAMPSNA